MPEASIGRRVTAVDVAREAGVSRATVGYVLNATTDKALLYPRVLDELLSEACHVDAARENNRIESDHSRLKARLRPMRGLKWLRSA